MASSPVSSESNVNIVSALSAGTSSSSLPLDARTPALCVNGSLCFGHKGSECLYTHPKNPIDGTDHIPNCTYNSRCKKQDDAAHMASFSHFDPDTVEMLKAGKRAACQALRAQSDAGRSDDQDGDTDSVTSASAFAKSSAIAATTPELISSRVEILKQSCIDAADVFALAQYITKCVNVNKVLDSKMDTEKLTTIITDMTRIKIQLCRSPADLEAFYEHICMYGSTVVPSNSVTPLGENGGMSRGRGRGGHHNHGPRENSSSDAFTHEGRGGRGRGRGRGGRGGQTHDTPRMCRNDTSCVRKGCHFAHTGRGADASGNCINDETCTHFGSGVCTYKHPKQTQACIAATIEVMHANR